MLIALNCTFTTFLCATNSRVQDQTKATLIKAVIGYYVVLRGESELSSKIDIRAIPVTIKTYVLR